MAKPTVDKLEGLFDVLVDELKTRITNGEASAADLGNVIRLLKDNSITADVADNAALNEMQAKLAEMRAKRGRGRGALASVDTAVSAEEADAATAQASAMR